MTLWHHHSLAMQLRPEGWGHAPSPLFALDAFCCDGAAHLLIRPELSNPDLLDALRFDLDDMPCAPAPRPVPRGSLLRFSAPGQKITIGGPGDTTLTLAVAPPSHCFAARNVVLTLLLDPDAEDLRIWLTHMVAHGAEAALLVLRRTPADTPDSARALEEALGDIPGLECGVILEAPLPLGHPYLPDQRTRHLAPDAPGKASLPPAQSDPWTAPFAETALLEGLRRRFLSRARAVLFAAPADLLAPSQPPVFDAAVAHGAVRLTGQAAYPFALDKDAPPRFGAHNCTAFDSDAAPSIWCVHPAKTATDAYWRVGRISGPPMIPHDSGFYRCMALLHPTLKPSELVPRAALIETPALAALSGGLCNAPQKPPALVPQLRPERWRNDTILAVTCMKNEGPFLLEWIAHQRAIGVTDILVYSNDCTDGTDRLLDLLDRRGIVRHLRNPFRETGEKPQHAALGHALGTDLAAKADWIWPCDVDEFAAIHIGDGRLHDLFNARPEANIWSLTWRLFGNNGLHRYEDRPVTAQFTRAAPLMTRKPHQAWGVKTLFRNVGFYRKLGVHRPKGFEPAHLDAIWWANGSGERLGPKIYRNGWRSNSGTVGYEWATLNHYAVRSAESFMVKRDRGRVNHVNRDQGLAYWFRMNHNAEEIGPLRHPGAEAERARLLDDPQIRAAHLACVAAHRARISALMQRADYRMLYDAITGPRLEWLSQNLAPFGTEIFEGGPDAVPPDLDWPMRQSA